MKVSNVFSLRTVAAIMAIAHGYRAKSSNIVDTKDGIEEQSYI